MSETFDNPRDRRKQAQELLSAGVHHSGVVQQILMGALYQSAGRSGLTTADKAESIRSMREAVKVARLNAHTVEQALTEASEHLDKALEMYASQASQESSLDNVQTADDLLKMIDKE